MTIQLTEREELISCISDAHKDAYGTRPRHIDYNNMSIDDLNKIADQLNDAVGEAIKAEEKFRAEQEVAFEALIQKNIALGASDRKTALRWIVEAEYDSYINVVDGHVYVDAGYVCYSHGINYSYETEIANAVKQ